MLRSRNTLSLGWPTAFCHRLVDLLWLAHDESCETELAALIAGSLSQGELPEARALQEKLEPRRRALPDDTPVALTNLASFQRHWQALAERADAEGWPASRFLAALAEIELAERDARRIQRHLQ